jgi:tetratricopeptide (TPR) repeat protein
LGNFEIIPFEGATEARSIYHEAAIKMAFAALKKSDYKTAVKYVEKAKLWPKNLGAGAPYNVDERLENSILVYCYNKLNNKEKEQAIKTKIIEYHLDMDDNDDARLYLQVIALQGIDEGSKAEQLVSNVLENDPENKYVQWVNVKMSEVSSQVDITDGLTESSRENPLDNSFLLLLEFLEILNQ